MDQARAKRRLTIAVLLIAGSSLAVGLVLYARVRDLADDALAHLSGELPEPELPPPQHARLEAVADGIMAGDSAAPAPVAEFLAHLAARRYDDAHGLLSAAWREALPPVRFRLVAESTPHLRAPQSFLVQEARADEGRWLHGILTSAAGVRPARFRLVEEDGQPRIADLWLDGVSVLPRPVR